MRTDVTIFELDGKSPFNLLAAAKRHGNIDIEVIIGSTHQLPVRLVAQQLPEDIAAERRRKAKKNRDRRSNPNKVTLALLGWEIFVTNVSTQIWSAENVCSIYGLRWRIETIFKAWKSNFHMAQVPRANAIRVKAYIYSALILVTLFHALIFKNIFAKNKQHPKRYVSLLKLSKFFKEQLWVIPLCLQNEGFYENFMRQMLYHSCYEQRRNRLCYHQILSSLS